jgi:tetratricopeptide (TPR) repeat protein
LRAPKRRLYLFCAAWVGVTLAPMMLLHSVYHLVQDYYLYLPSVGWSLLVGDLIVVIARKNAVARRLAFGGAAAMLLIYGAALWRVQRFWHDDIAAARGYIEGCPESTAWRLTLAIDLEHEGDLAQAENEVRAALRLEPDKTGTIHPSSKTLEQVLGMLLAEQGDIAGAELELRKSAAEPEEDNVRISAARLAYVEDTFALYGQGLANQASGRVDQAIKDISEAIERMTSVPSPRFLPLALRYVPLVELYDAKGNSEQVQSLLNKLESMPVGDMASGLARAMIRLQHSDKEGAERILRDLAERYPNDPEVLMRLGDLQADLNQHEEALNSYGKISDWVGHPRLYASTAKSLHALGREREALEQCRLALALAPTRDRQTQFVCLQIQQAIQNK